MTAVVVRPATPGDRRAVAAVHEAAFADGGLVARLEAALGERGGPGGCSLVAEEDGEVVGHVRCTPAWLDDPRRLVTVEVLSPLGVLPRAQGRGIGVALVTAAVADRMAAGVPALFLEGSPAYYGRLGFRPAGRLGFRAPSLRIPEAAFQVVLGDGGDRLSGTLVYPEVFWRFDAVGLREPQAGDR